MLINGTSVLPKRGIESVTENANLAAKWLRLLRLQRGGESALNVR
jgi:hypothetical protein